ncbi:hypothetical protein PsYK624_082220 [Phanerochaete sordida]|uniref:TPR-like protein n=1 Tax=Phanerochaete sordida TaxID=48140 RepID=A0A9P3GCZ7_9APHY|nr:hypothetical protein PsYK624_082220 [Phanerochaete sordida]
MTANHPPSARAAVQASRLKEEGDKLFKSQKYAAACAKYSAAIELDKDNAVLWANRGACLWAVANYIDAARDCEVATRLNPKYTKAWVRLARCYERVTKYSDSRDAYIEAMKLLQGDDLSVADKSLKRQCHEGLKIVLERIANGSVATFCPTSDVPQLPWMKAYSMRQEICKMTKEPASLTSGWILLDAYRQMRKGLDLLKKIRSGNVSDDPREDEVYGECGALESMTAGIMICERVMFIDIVDFEWRYDMQVELECRTYKAFREDTLNGVIAAAEAMQAKKGWAAVCLPLTATLRTWILMAHMADSLEGNVTEALDLFNNAVALLEWAYKNIPEPHRGGLFQRTILRRLKCLRLECYANARRRNKAKYSLAVIRSQAKAILADLDAEGPPAADVTPTHKLAYYVYPRALANLMLGSYYDGLGVIASQQGDRVKVHESYATAAEHLLRAVELYPKDDEKHLETLIYAIDAMLFADAYTVREALDALERLRDGVPVVDRLWGGSANAKVRGTKVFELRMVELEMRRALEAGEVSMGSIAVRPNIGLDFGGGR